ncbi:anthranilate synthase component I family protein [Glaciihabitans sp. dw_435]|uniref:anthranilate synthase component I family protein n=1 Tax=Glaciihabitans sp. dw_435 TaxID=2720081 RepID=UPI001BD3CAE4|nr:anthranilate synthase component I family protein [Glaciihabitans sp. dw_435]
MRPRILWHPIDVVVDPDAAFVALFGDSTDVVWLDSNSAAAGKSYLGRAARTVSSDDIDGSVLDFLRAELGAVEVDAGRDGFALGWLGWLSYELRFETMGAERTRRSRYPDAAFLYLDRAIEFDHGTSTITLLALGSEWDDELTAWRDETTEALRGARPPARPRKPRLLGSAYWRYSDDKYLAMIGEAQAAIAAGDAYLLCLTSEFRVQGAPDVVSTYRALRTASPSHHGGLLRIGGVALLSASPEQFLSVSPDGVIQSRPIKGTRRRGATPDEDALLRDELLHSEKERAENLMIVDLMRNDIAQVSEIGSVDVTSLLAVESYAQVHQLVSTVRGQLRADLHGVDAVAACFPAGSMTGAPKRAATEILDRIEQRPRGIYSGAFGYFGLDGRIDLAMVIRSIVIDADGATVGSGGGITALSDPAEELDEVYLKAAALLGVLGADD